MGTWILLLNIGLLGLAVLEPGVVEARAGDAGAETNLSLASAAAPGFPTPVSDTTESATGASSAQDPASVESEEAARASSSSTPLEAPGVGPPGIPGSSGMMLERVSRVLELAPLKPIVPERLPQIELRVDARERLSQHHPKSMLAARNSMLKTMGLLPEGFNLRDAMLEKYPREVVGVYDPVDGRLTLCKDLEPEEQDEVLFHELVHALQDQHFHLRELIPEGGDDEDRARAVRAVVEGQAVRVAEQLSGASFERVAPQRRDEVPDPTPEILALLGPHAPAVSPGALRHGGSQLYQTGATFVGDFERKFGAGSAVLYALPTTTEQLIHFDRYLAHEPALEVTLRDLPFHVAGRWKLVDQMSMGELNVAFWLGEQPGGAVSTGWGGDRLAGFLADDGRSMTAWRTVWDTENDAMQFQRAAGDRLRHRFPESMQVQSLAEGFVLSTSQGAHGLVRQGTEVRLIDGAELSEVMTLLTGEW